MASNGIKEARRYGEERKKNGEVFQEAVKFFCRLRVQPSLHLPKVPLKNVFTG